LTAHVPDHGRVVASAAVRAPGLSANSSPRGRGAYVPRASIRQRLTQRGRLDVDRFLSAAIPAADPLRPIVAANRDDNQLNGHNLA
jgi:hypothetical protein